VDFDPDWIRIQWGPWIRIRIRNPDPDPRGQINESGSTALLQGHKKIMYVRIFILYHIQTNINVGIFNPIHLTIVYQKVNDVLHKETVRPD
jgi:hypothetical protein